MAVNPAGRELKNIVIYKYVKSKLMKNLENYFFKMLRLFIMKGGFVCTQIHVRSSLGNRFRAVRRIRLILYSSLQSDGSEFLLSTLFCFFRMADSGSLFLVH